MTGRRKEKKIERREKRMTEPGEENAPKKSGGWQLSLMLAGSAALGGIAVVVWNRRLLSQLRVSETPASRREADEG